MRSSHPGDLGRFCLVIAVFFYLQLFATVSLADQNRPHADTELFNLYFDDTQLVEAATSSPKPINQVAENCTIITSEEIEALHAHNIFEVLNRVSGMFLSFSPNKSLLVTATPPCIVVKTLDCSLL